MTYRSWLLLCFVAVAGADPVLAVAAEDCAALDDPQARLACYDARFPRADPETPAPPVSPRATREAPPVPSEPSLETPKAVTETPVPAVLPDPERPTEDRETAASAPAKTGPFGDEKVDLTTTIRAIRAGEKQKMVFLLANEQIWIQSTPRPLPFKNGDTVTIRNATLGGYFMRSEKGTSTRVQRIH